MFSGRARLSATYIARDDDTNAPAGQRATYRFTREENGLQIRRYWSSESPTLRQVEHAVNDCFPSTRLASHEGQNPRRLQEKATSLSCPQSP
jgi:hypothetical protein